MSKFDYFVEANVDEVWVHAHCATLEEATKLAEALELLADIQSKTASETIWDVDVYASKDASDAAKAALRIYEKQKFATFLQQEVDALKAIA